MYVRTWVCLNAGRCGKGKKGWGWGGWRGKGGWSAHLVQHVRSLRTVAFVESDVVIFEHALQPASLPPSHLTGQRRFDWTARSDLTGEFDWARSGLTGCG